MEKETFVARALFERHYLSNMRRVLAVGDIHGRFDLLQQRLDQLDFDPEQDVAILLGDLVDRSDGSLDALEWCARPGILRVRGNHEQITAIAASDPDSIDYHRRCGGHWFEKIKDAVERRHWAEVLEDCPIAIEAVLHDGRRIGFVHRSEEHTSELQSLMRSSYAVFCLKKKIILYVIYINS